MFGNGGIENHRMLLGIWIWIVVKDQTSVILHLMIGHAAHLLIHVGMDKAIAIRIVIVKETWFVVMIIVLLVSRIWIAVRVSPCAYLNI